MTVRFVDLVGGNNANDGSTFALRKLTLASATSGLSGGDTVKVMASPDATSLAQNATFTNGSDTVTLTTAVTANIDTCESAWTASANVTATAQSTTQREGTNAASLVIASGFTTGLVAYHAMASTDFSAYKQISFLIRTSAALASGVLTLSLCSDNAGVTAVNTVTIPAITSGQWTAVVVDTGGALGSAIQSVAINALSDPGSITVFLDNIIACKDSTAADSLTHYSLIGKNTGTEPWMAIDSINGTTIKLAGGYQSTASRSGMQPYYYGTTDTVTLYKREPIILTAGQVPAGGASMDSPINIECGYDRTAMTTQNSLTFMRLRDPSLNAIDASTNSYVYLNKCYAANASVGFNVNRGWRFGEFGAIACASGLKLNQSLTADAMSDVTRYAVQCGSGIVTASNGSEAPAETRLKLNYLWGHLNSSSSNHAVKDVGSFPSLATLLVAGCDIQGFYSAFGNDGVSAGQFAKAIFQNCTLKNLTNDGYTPSQLFFVNCAITSVTVRAGASTANYYVNQGGDTTSHKIAFGSSAGLGTIVSDASVRHTAADFSWKFVNTSNGSSYGPSILSVAKVACVANEQRTVKLYFRRDSTSLNMRLRVKGALVAGVLNDVVATMSEAINTWGGDGSGNPLQVQFTPTQQCVVEVFAEAWGATANGWVDDLTVT